MRHYTALQAVLRPAVSAEQTGKKGDKSDADECHTAARHKLLDTLRLRTVGVEKFSDKHCKTGTAS